MAAKPTTTPDFLGIGPYADLVADAILRGATDIEKEAAEHGQSRIVAHAVQMVRLASTQVDRIAKALAEDEKQ